MMDGNKEGCEGRVEVRHCPIDVKWVNEDRGKEEWEVGELKEKPEAEGKGKAGKEVKMQKRGMRIRTK